ncbi:MAG TPA: DNA polymerase domain-containing protein [archaeon]|nr:DNA polymerase domain-containing protein [archaeon]
MELDFQVIDCDYVLVDNSPIIRIFGKAKDGKTVCAFHRDFYPYFYVLPKKGKQDDFVKFMQDNYKNIVVKIEEVEKFLSIGYQKQKTKLLKITLKDPSQVANIREEIRAKPFMQEIFEADILFKYRFMVDHNISAMKWIKVTGDVASTSTVSTDRGIAVKTIKNIETDENVPLKYMGIDIEVVQAKEAVPDPKKDPIAMVSLSFYPAFEARSTLVLVSKPIKKHDGVQIFKGEKEMLEELIKIFASFDPDVVCGFNSNNFDFPYIEERFRANKLSRAIGRCNQKQMVCKKFGLRFRTNFSGRVVVDVYDLIKESVGKGLLRLKRYGLGDVSRELLNEDKIGISHSEIEKHWNGDENQVKRLVDYARKDAELVLKLLLEKEMLGKFIEVSKVSGLLLQDVLDSGEAARAENLLLREFNKLDFVVPCKPTPREVQRRIDEREAKGLKGALVLEPQIGLHTSCIVYLDFKSMYPSIFISWNICPTTLLLSDAKVDTIKTPYGAKFVSPKVREGITQKIVNHLISERDRIKKQSTKNDAEKKILDAKQYAFKIMANAFYGYTGYVRARFYVLDIANAITSCGRDIIQRTKEIVEQDQKFKVVYGDTDSIMVKLQTSDLDQASTIGKGIEEKINKELNNIVRIKIENVFKSLLVLTKKRYAGLSFEKTNGTWEEKLVMKGIETVRRDWCDLVSKTLFDVLGIILREQNPKKAFNYVKGVLSKLEKNEISIEDLVITKSVSKSLKDYKGIQPHIELIKKLKKRSPATAPGVGDRIGFVIVQGLQLMSERAEDPDYIKQHNLKIDSKYYIESQLLPPLERVFEAIGIGKSELIGMGKQMIIADAIKNKTSEEPVTTIEGFICNKCNKTARRIPLMGKCLDCGGEMLFYSGGAKSRYYSATC